jgi:hypothetical protein
MTSRSVAITQSMLDAPSNLHHPLVSGLLDSMRREASAVASAQRGGSSHSSARRHFRVPALNFDPFGSVGHVRRSGCSANQRSSALGGATSYS